MTDWVDRCMNIVSCVDPDNDDLIHIDEYKSIRFIQIFDEYNNIQLLFPDFSEAEEPTKYLITAKDGYLNIKYTTDCSPDPCVIECANMSTMFKDLIPTSETQKKIYKLLAK